MQTREPVRRERKRRKRKRKKKRRKRRRKKAFDLTQMPFMYFLYSIVKEMPAN